MPHPIWSHAAERVTEMIQRDIVLTPEQELAIRSYVSRVPVRCVVDLLMTLNINSLTMGEAILTTTARDLLGIFDRATAHADHHMAIISRLRDIVGQDAWFDERSSCYEYANQYFQCTRDIEERVGFDPQYLSTLYTMLTEFSDDESGNETDDDDGNDDGSDDGTDDGTATTIVIDDDDEGPAALAAPTVPSENDEGATSPSQDNNATRYNHELDYMFMASREYDNVSETDDSDYD